jgi:broad specificity phosphatase PhoE
VALVGHQIVNKVLACTILGLSLDQIWRIGQEIAALSVFQWARHGWLSLCINDTCHLPVIK